MLSPRWMKVVRDLRLHAARTGLVVVAIIIGLAGAGSVLDTWALMRQVTREQYRQSKPPSATLHVDAADARAIESVRGMASVAAVRARRTLSGSVRLAAKPAPLALVAFALDDFTSAQIGRLAGESGAWPPPDGGIVIERSSVEFAGIAIGDTVTVSVADGADVRLPVVGIGHDVGLAPGWMEHLVYAFVTRGTLRTLGASDVFDEVQVVVRDSTLDRAGVRAVVSDVRRVLEGRGVAVRRIDVPEPGRHIHAAQIDSLLYTQGAFGAIALLLSGILVVNLVAAMLTGEVREIGVMKAIGATPSQVAGMYLVLALVLGVVASLVAIPLAAAVGRSYAIFTSQILNFDARPFAIPRWAFAVQFAIGTIFPVLAAALPVTRGVRISVGSALRDTGIDGSGGREPGAFDRWLGERAGLARPMLLSIRNAFRKRQRMALTLLTLAVGGAVYIGALNLRASVRGAVGLVFRMQRFDVAFRLTDAWPPDSLERVVAATPGVTRAEAWGGARATLVPGGDAQAGGGEPFSISAVPPSTALLAHDVAEGRWLQEGDSLALVVNRRLLTDEPTLRVGERVMLSVAGRAARWTVVGVVETGLFPTAYASRDVVAALTTPGRADRIVVAAAGGVAVQRDVLQRLRLTLTDAGFPVREAQLMTEQHAVVEDHLLMVASFLGAMGGLMIIVGGLALASTMGMAVLERTREIGILRAIGARHGAIMTLVQIEGLVIALAGWALAIPLSLPMSVALAKAFGRIMLPLAVTWLPDAVGVASWLAVAVVVSLLACAWPAWRATRITTRAALSYE